MHPLHRCRCVLWILLLALLDFCPAAQATDGEPLAVRRWPGGTVSIETHWDLHLVINPTAAAKALLPREADQILSDSSAVDHVLFRTVNSAQPKWVSSGDYEELDANAVRVRSTGGDGQLRTVSVDGATVGFLSLDAVNQAGHPDGISAPDVDLLVLFAGQNVEPPSDSLVSFVVMMSPKLVLWNPVTGNGADGAATFQAALDPDGQVTVVNHNTLALSVNTPKSEKPRVVALSDRPWTMPENLERRFAAMEKSIRNSQQIFEKLTIEQMNFKPANGTHTPRWNTEHMMGRQLLFFSQIYHAQEPSIPVMDLNPEQMPPDYVFAHPTWDGREEARQMQRVSNFTRRFAYLLDGVALNEKAPGSGWPTLDALLRQMERHYSEHTANTVKKFALPGWPR